MITTPTAKILPFIIHREERIPLMAIMLLWVMFAMFMAWTIFKRG